VQTIKRYEQSEQMGLCQTLIHHLNLILVGGDNVIGWNFNGLKESSQTTERIITMEDYIKERIRIWEWLCRGYGRHGLQFRQFQYITKEWLIKNYNVEEEYFR
jgi:hypothetical protein